MPHFGLMDPDVLGEVAAARQRSRLHVRSGRRRLREGRRVEGLGTLYDALLSGMRWAVLTVRDSGLAQDGGAHVLTLDDADLWDSARLYGALRADGAIRRDMLDLARWDEVVDADDSDLDDDEVVALAAQVAEALTHLGILPFDERDLPAEPPDPR